MLMLGLVVQHLKQFKLYISLLIPTLEKYKYVA